MNSELVVTKFDENSLNKIGSLFTCGNGYLGLRYYHSEGYINNNPGLYISGVYNKFCENEVVELVNLPDIASINITLNNQRLNLCSGNIKDYSLVLNLKNGEVIRKFIWNNYEIIIKQFCSMSNKHLIVTKVLINSHDVFNINIVTGINARVTNSGVSHLQELMQRVFNETMYAKYITTQSEIEVNYLCKVVDNGKHVFDASNRFLSVESVLVTNSYEMTKYSMIYTNLDDIEESEILFLDCISKSYEELLLENDEVWKSIDETRFLKLDSSDEFEMLAVNFANYHLNIMTPFHLNKCGIGAKGLTGEGYKGHIFWDSEIFILPYFLYTTPSIARNLLMYRCNNLDSARVNAKLNGYAGAMFPWESALDGFEETPKWGKINIRTGKRQLVASKEAEHHIVADIAYSIINYFNVTKDELFIKEIGYEVLIECVNFWLSRATKTKKGFEILNVIGPDEYTEYIDNNSYTNYLVKYVVEQTIAIAKLFDIYIDDKYKYFADNLYLLKSINNVVPQDDTFLSKNRIDITKYRNDAGKQTILNDFSRDEVIDLQVLKQADVIMLMHLLNNQFSYDEILNSWKYYEEKTIHDSSLSKGVYGIVANRINLDLGDNLFTQSLKIDLNDDYNSSNDGIHAASIGLIWQGIIFGYVNLEVDEECISIKPRLKDSFNYVEFNMEFRSVNVSFKIDKICIEVNCDNEINVLIFDEMYIINKNKKIMY